MKEIRNVTVKQLTKICWHLSAPQFTPDFLGKEPCLRTVYFVLQLSDWMMEASMLLAEARVHRHW